MLTLSGNPSARFSYHPDMEDISDVGYNGYNQRNVFYN